MIYYLKTASEQEMWEALETAGLAVRDYDMSDEANVMPEDADPYEWSATGAYEWRFTGKELDMIGTIYVVSGTTPNEDGVELQTYSAIDGFHANLMAQSGITGLPEVPKPATPYRMWAGV